jgi:Skp family chaperone for outer membrane proteins
MFTPKNAMILITACLVVGLLTGCGKPPEPCAVSPSSIQSVDAQVAQAEKDLAATKAEIKDLEAEYQAKSKKLQDLEAQKKELEDLKSKVEGDGPPKR